MTAYATRSPLQLVTNTHNVMSAPRRSTRRSSARIAEQEDPAPAPAPVKTKAVFAEATPRAPRRKDASVAESKGSKAGVNGAAATSTRRGKRKLDYDEDDDGFMFTRTKTKRTKPSKEGGAPGSAEDEGEPEPPPLSVRKSRAKPTNPVPHAVETHEDNGLEPQRSAPKGAEKTLARSGEGRKGRGKAGAQQPKIEERVTTPEPQRGEATKIALPFADTPVIRRNKEMRKEGRDGSRRSSLKMRGRRASSLIDSGTSNALPHAEVSAAEFYKHIESGLPEPRRMKQLLTWCATRALGDKPAFASKNSHAKLAAHEIKQQLLDDISTQSQLSDWFSREDQPGAGSGLRPNPRNVANQAKIHELEQRLAHLQAERETWHALLHPALPLSRPPPTRARAPATLASVPFCESDARGLRFLIGPPAAAPSSPSASASTPASGPTSAAAAASASTAAPAPSIEHLGPALAARTRRVAAAAEFQTDALADSSHLLAQHLAHAVAAGRQILRGSATALAARDGPSTSETGTRDVLRALSRTIER